MPLECTVICLDNSEWMRNGDYSPTRLGAQYDMTSMLIGAKLRANVESTVGVLTMAGQGIKVLTSPTTDQGQLYSGIHGVPISGSCNITAGIQVAMLALKHRENKKGSQRVILVVGSPITIPEKKLIQVGKKMRKMNVCLDIISMGENEENEEKLQKLIEVVNKDDNCHLVTVPAGLNPSDIVKSSAIVSTVSSAGGASGGNDFAEYGGIDPSLDPELAMAMQASMAAMRQEAEASTSAQSNDANPAAPSADGGEQGVPVPPATAAAGAGGGDGDMSADDLMLQQALAMSMAAMDADSSGASKADSNTDGAGATMDVDGGSDAADADAALQAALAMSTAASTGATAPASGGADASGLNSLLSANGVDAGQFNDPSFINSLLSELPGVDVNDPAIQAALAGNGDAAGKKDGEGDKGQDGK